MSIRFPKDCTSREDRSRFAAYVAHKGWEKRRAPRVPPVWIGAIAFLGPLAGGKDMRLDLFAVEGQRKWTGRADGAPLRDRLSERSVLKIVRGILRAPRAC